MRPLKSTVIGNKENLIETTQEDGMAGCDDVDHNNGPKQNLWLLKPADGEKQNLKLRFNKS